MNEFAKRLKALREERNLTQKKLAEALKVSEASVKRWEQWKDIRAINLVYISKYFNVSIDYITGRDHDKTIY